MISMSIYGLLLEIGSIMRFLGRDLGRIRSGLSINAIVQASAAKLRRPDVTDETSNARCRRVSVGGTQDAAQKCEQYEWNVQ
jgi:hypothetical protein